METCCKTKIALIVHGGAGHISKSRYDSKLNGVQRAVRIGFNVLKNTNNPVDAVEAAIKEMELDEGFNAGYGSMLASNGEVEMDAIIIRGSDLKAGGVGAIRHVTHPISVSKAVMEKTPHVLLVGEGAEEFAIKEGFPQVSTESLTSPHAKQLLNLILDKKADATTEISAGGTLPSSSKKNEGSGGTVGAIAINSEGHLAAGTSTGGIAAKLPGRVGDTPIIGGGTLCDDDTCGVSATGLGEAIMRSCVSSRIAEFIRQGYPPSDACLMALEYMTSKMPEGDGGAIVITKEGEIGYNFNSPQMAWAYIREDDDKLHYGIEKGEDFTVNF